MPEWAARVSFKLPWAPPKDRLVDFTEHFAPMHMMGLKHWCSYGTAKITIKYPRKQGGPVYVNYWEIDIDPFLEELKQQ